jgi:glycosyltransferase involved in cell wall biosynthesis
MKILINCLQAHSGGAVSYLHNLMPALINKFEESSDSHNLIFLAYESQKNLILLTSESIYIILQKDHNRASLCLLWELQNIPRIVREHNIDILFVPYQVGLFKTSAKHILMLRNMEPFLSRSFRYSFKTWLRNYILKYLSINSLKKADRLIAVSEHVKDFAVDELNIPSSKIRRIYHGRDLYFRPDGDKTADLKLLTENGVEGDFILTCGSLLPYRRCEDVIEAFSSLEKDVRKDIKLVIAGSGTDPWYSRLIDNLIQRLGCPGQILMVGHVPQNVMQALYRQCLVCIIASEIEACPNIAIEAMSTGCVIVSSDSPPLPEIFNGCSIEFRKRDIEDLRDKIHLSLTDDLLRSRLKNMALERATAFSWEKCASETYSALVDW